MHPAWRFVRWTVFCRPGTVLCFTPRTCALVAVIACMPVHLVPRSILKLAILVAVARWTSAPSVQEVLKKTIRQPNSKNMDVIGWQKVNYLFVLKCALQKPYSPEMAISFRISIVSVLLLAALAQAPGAGVQLIKQKVPLGARQTKVLFGFLNF